MAAATASSTRGGDPSVDRGADSSLLVRGRRRWHGVEPVPDQRDVGGVEKGTTGQHRDRSAAEPNASATAYAA